MHGFLAALQFEIYIALRSNGSRLLLLLPLLVASLRLLLVRAAESGAAARDALLADGGNVDFASGNGYGYLVDSLHTGITLLGLILVAQAAYTFAWDRDTGLLRHVLIRRSSRAAATLAKLAHLHLQALVSLLLLMAGSWLLSGALWDFGPVVEDGYELISRAEIHQELRLGLLLGLLPLPAGIAFGLLVSVLAQSAAQSLSIALGITLAMDLFKSLLGNQAYYLYVSFQPSLLDQSYLGEVSRLVRGYSDVLLDERMLQLNYWVPLPQMILLSAAAVLLATRKKI